MDKLKMHTPDRAGESFKKLSELFPNAVTETLDENGAVIRAIDKDVLMQEISCAVVDGSEERYRFTWPDKKKAVLAANTPTDKTLRPCRGESVDFDNTENLYIEGDNLDVMKLLRGAYSGKIKMIYIDPPYNTGNDLVYNDDFAVSAREYKSKEAQPDIDGLERDGSGRLHTDWLNMMYPRLKIARELLSDDGVIFISISDAEADNLKKIADEIFGSSNYCGDIIWNSTKSVTNTALISVSHTYNLIYFKKISYFTENRDKFRLPEDGKGFENPDNDPRGKWKADPFQVGGWRPNQQYEIVNPNTGVVYKPNSGCSWKNDYNKFKELVADNRIVFGKTGEGGPQRKRFLRDARKRGKVAKTWWDDVETTTNGTQMIKKLFGGKTVFDNPKPVGLIYRMLQLGTGRDGIVLDFFSGSATAAHAVMKLNADDGGKRRFIMIQLPEETSPKSEAYKAGYVNICEIGKERIRRAAKKLAEDDPKAEFDGGFRVIKCDSSNMNDAYYAPENASQNTLIREGRTPGDLLFQVMPELGVPFSAKIEKINIGENEIFIAADGILAACFDEKMTDSVITDIARKKPRFAVFRSCAAAGAEIIFEKYSPETVIKAF